MSPLLRHLCLSSLSRACRPGGGGQACRRAICGVDLREGKKRAHKNVHIVIGRASHNLYKQMSVFRRALIPTLALSSVGAASVTAIHTQTLDSLPAPLSELIAATAVPFTTLPLPSVLRASAYGWYARMLSIDVSQLSASLTSYRSLHAFLCRDLHTHARPIASGIVAPCDATVLAVGPIGAYGKMPLPQGPYSVRDLIVAGEREQLAHTGVAVADESQSGARLWCVVMRMQIYDVHAIVAPVEWNVQERRNVQGWRGSGLGDLLEKERVALLGGWKWGWFAVVLFEAVGKSWLNVQVGEHWKKRPFWPQIGKVETDTVDQCVKKGDTIANLGSMVVMVFEAPEKGFKFQVEEGQKVKMGQTIALVEDTASVQEIVKPKETKTAKSSASRKMFRRAW